MFNVVLGILGSLVFISIVLSILILTQKHRHTIKVKTTNKIRNYFFKKYIDEEDITMRVSQKKFLDALIEVDEQIHLDVEVRNQIINDIITPKFIKKMNKKLHSRSTFKRKIGAFYLARIRTDESYTLLYNRFMKEKNESVKLRIVSQLRYGLKEDYLNDILESLIDATPHYQKRLCILLGNNYKRIYPLYAHFKEDTRYPIVLGLIRISNFHSDSQLLDYSLNKLQEVLKESPYNDSQTDTLIEEILTNIVKHTPDILNQQAYLKHHHPLVKKYALKSLAYSQKKACVEFLSNDFDDSSLDQVRIDSLSQIVFYNRQYLNDLIAIYNQANTLIKKQLTHVFASRIDYILLKYETIDDAILASILNSLISEEIVEPIIDFINTNDDDTLQTFIMESIISKINDNKSIKDEFRMYLNNAVLHAYDLEPLEKTEPPKPKPPFDKKKMTWIIRWIIFTLLFFPLLFIIHHNTQLLTMSFSEIITRLVIDVNVYLVGYFATVNIIYVILLLLAYRGSNRQVELAKTRKYTTLFTNKLLPGISIIAPAYNEEKSIIDSLTSLLNLQYPRYEVVVVNDGSKDDTLQKLIDYFELERKHKTINRYVETKNIRGIYFSPTIPNLVVVDKQNGGKADALNAGINVSRHNFVCGIDADSILEGDALLKLASTMLDDTKPFVALGGNIYPANGFTFDKGQVESRGLAKETICRFQTIEYLRAFTSGRIGWSELRSLMIISGAFGLFQKQALVDTGGYLTSSSKYKKDTVGEDMELVVRLTKEALNKKDPYRVVYVYNAFCYTELPSDLRSLLKQRNRWRRGLIDILSYHRDLAWKPKYKQIGFLGYPYYFFFEFMGPFVELIGYIMLIIALSLSLLTPTIILAIFTASIALGVVVSLSAVLMTEREILMLNKKETLLLIIFAILDNFGYRQLIRMNLVLSTFTALRETGAWGTQKRKGFKS